MVCKAQTTWNECLSLNTKQLAQHYHLLWVLVAELDTGRCPAVGAHQLSNVLEALAPLNQTALLDSVGTHFIKRLRSYGLSTDYLNATSVLSRPLICWFASYGCTRSLQLLIDADINVNIRELRFETGNPTALLLAAGAGFPECVRVLLQGGANLLLLDEHGSSVLHEAADSCNSDDHTQLAILHTVLTHPDAHTLLAADSKDHRVVSLAASKGFAACVKLLLEAHKPELRQQMATAALFGAAAENHVAVAETLISAGATSVTQTDADMPSALEVSHNTSAISSIYCLSMQLFMLHDFAAVCVCSQTVSLRSVLLRKWHNTMGCQLLHTRMSILRSCRLAVPWIKCSMMHFFQSAASFKPGSYGHVFDSKNASSADSSAHLRKHVCPTSLTISVP